MKTLILVSKIPIVIQIFSLVCKKLNISLEVLDTPQIDHKVDIVVLDNTFLDEKFNILKTYCKLIGAISNEELPFEMANNFLIPSPFLPSTLENILQEQLQELHKRATAKTYVTTVEEPIELEDDLTENEDFLEEYAVSIEKPSNDPFDSLVSNIADDINEDLDDSIVHSSVVETVKGGILDKNELSKLEGIIDQNPPNLDKLMDEHSVVDESEEWTDLSSIIDQAIDEINSTDNLTSDDMDASVIELILNNYSMNELRPLFELLNQDVIDKLADGKEILLKVRLDK